MTEDTYTRLITLLDDAGTRYRAGSVSGSITPFCFDPGLELLVDPELLSHEGIFFNAARLDRSVALGTGDYVRLAGPRIEPVADAPVVTVA
ncbi:YbaK/EbsC family protein [Streptomyces sp. M41]|uniref:YbaK/EbsC family protein n=1 Tax=Streptomyces sp. M41 TaxID=3059412 RepID=UPI00374D45A5